MIDFHAMMGNAPNPYMILDREFRFVWANGAYERATMRSFDEIEGAVLFDAFPPPDEETERRLRDSIQRAFDTGQTDELAFIEYAIRNPDGSMAHNIWSATHTPFRDQAGEVAWVLQHTVDITELETLRRLRDGAGVIDRARAAEQRFRDISAEAMHLRALFEQAPGFVAVVTGPEHRFLMANAAYRRLVGERDVIGKPVAEALPEVVEQGFIELLDKVVASGRAYVGSQQKIFLIDPATGVPQDRYLEFIYQTIKDADGTVTGVFVQGHDVTDEVEAQQRQRLLINELNHRVKNTLALVQGLAQQSFGRSPDDRFDVFSARLGALASAHTLLTAATWESTDLRELVRSSLEATAGSDLARCSLDGPTTTIAPQLAVTLAMIVHELSTNAIKYGGLSTAAGRVAISWSTSLLRGATELIIDWRESGGPPVVAPQREGFGARLIRRGLSGQGRAVIDYDPGGLHCCIEATL